MNLFLKNFSFIMKFKQLTIILVLICFSLFSFAQDRTKLLEQELAKVEKLLSEMNNKSEQTVQKLSLITKQISTTETYLEDLAFHIGTIEEVIKENTEKINVLEKKIVASKEQYSKLLILIYKTRSLSDKTLYIFAAEDFTQAYKRYMQLRYFAEYSEYLIEQLKEQTNVLKKATEELEFDKNNKLNLIQKKNIVLKDLKKSKENQKILLEQLRKNKKKIQADYEKKKKKNADLHEQIKKEIPQKVQKEIKKTDEDVFFEKRKGTYSMPLKGVITETFGEHKHAVLEDVTIRNNGIDIRAAGSKEVYSIAQGIVSKIFNIPGANNAIIVKHGNYYTVYSNLGQVYVSEGDEISARKYIADVFKDDNSEDSGVLNFQIWKGTEKLNPELWLK